MDGSGISPEIGSWFKENRESYEWPPGSTQKISQERIMKMCSGVQTSIIDSDRNALRSMLVEIHQWKTGGQHGTTNKYCSALESKGSDYLDKLMGYHPFVNINNLEATIRYLKISNCNLPACTAIASFLYCRRDVPIFDKYLAKFFAHKFSIPENDKSINQVLGYVKNINFQFEKDGRPNNYNRIGFNHNLEIYITEFVPECIRISKDIQELNICYVNIYGRCVEFLPIDVEMAIFSWARKHSQIF